MKKFCKEMYGDTPKHFLDSVDSALQSEDALKRKGYLRVALATAVLIMFASVALAVAGRYGVLSFLYKDKLPDTETVSNVQTLLNQSGDDLSNVSVKVRDAVTDGITVLLTVEMKARHEDDMLMTLEDKSFMMLSEQGIDLGEMTGREQNKPDWSLIPQNQKYIYISAPHAPRVTFDSTTSMEISTIGSEYFYEGNNSVVYTMIYDISELEKNATPFTLSFEARTAKIVGETDTIGETSNAEYRIPSWDYADKATVSVDVRPSYHELKSFTVEGASFRVGEMEYTEVLFTMSPYALYFDFQRTKLDDEADASTLVPAGEGEDISKILYLYDDQGRQYHQLWYTFVASNEKQDDSIKTERFIYSGHGEPYPNEMSIRGFYSDDPNYVYEVTVVLQEANA